MADVWDQFQDAPADGASLLSAAKRDYPYLANSGLIAVSGKDGGGRKLEYWPRGEPGNAQSPRPKGIPLDSMGVEIFDANVSPKDVLADYVSHEAVNSDPKLRSLYREFSAMVPDETMRKRYDYHRANFGENRDFTTWKERTGLPEYFRGYTFDQWADAKKFYTPQQLQKLDEIRRHVGLASQDPWAKFQDAEAPKKPLTANEAGLAATSGGYSGIANMFGLPVDTALNVADLAKAGIGFAQGAITGKPPSDVFLPSDRSKYFGSSAYIKDKMGKAGVVTENPRPDSRAARWLNKGAEIGTGVYLGSALPSPPRQPIPRPSAEQFLGRANANANAAAGANVNIGAGQAGAAANVQGALNARVQGGGYNFGTVGDDAATGLTRGQELARAGFPQGRLTPGQATGNKLLQRLEAKLESQPMTAGPFDRIKDVNAREINRAAARAIGETADNLNSEVLDRAVTRLGTVFDDVRDTNVRPINPADYVPRLRAIQDEFEAIGPQLMNHPLMERLVRHAQNGEASGRDLGNLTSKLTREINRQMTSAQGDRELGRALVQVKEYVDDLVAQGLSGDRLRTYEAARNQYRNLMLLTSRVGTINPSTGNVNGSALANLLQQKDRAGFLFGRNQSDMYNAARFGQAFRPIVGDSGTATRMPLPSPTDFVLSLPFNLATRAYTSSPAVNAALRTQAAAQAAAQAAPAVGQAVRPMATPGGLLGGMVAQDEPWYR